MPFPVSVCFLPLFNTHFLASNTESVTGRQSPSGEPSAPPSLSRAGREGGGPCLAAAGRSLHGGPRAAGEKGAAAQRDTAAGRPGAAAGGWPRKGGPQGRPGDRCSALSHPGLPGHRDGGPGWVRGGESWRYPCLPGPSQGQPARSAPGCPRAAAWRLWLRPGSGAWTPPPTSGAYPSLQRPSLCLSLPSPPFSLPPVTSPLGTSKCKMQKPGPTAAGRPALAAAQASSRPAHPRESKARSAEGQGSGAPSVGGTGEAGSGSQCRSWGGWRAEGGRMCVGRPGGLYSRRVQSSQCNASFERGAPGRPPGAARRVLEGRWGSRPPWASPWHQEPSRSRGQGWPFPLLLAPALPAEGCRRGFWAAHISRKPADAVPPCPSPASLCDMCLLVGAGIHPLPPDRSSGRKGSSIPRRPPCCPRPRAAGSLPGRWLEGAEEGTAPGAEGTPPGSPAPLKQMGAARAHDKYQQHEADSGPLRVSPESGGRGWRGRPGCSALVLAGRSPQGGQATFPGGWRRRRRRVDAPSHLLPWRDCPVRPAVGEREREAHQRVGAREGSPRTCVGAPGVPVGWCVGRTSSRPCPRLPGRPDTARARPLSLAAVPAAGQTALTSCLLVGQQGPQRERTGLAGV